MSSSFRRALAGMLARQLSRTAPPSRGDWAEAMRREQAEIEDPGEALRFSAGCLWACSLERLRSLDLLLRVARRAMTGGIAFFAVLCLLTAVRLGSVHAPSAFLVGAISAAFASASLLLARRGPAASAAIAAAMLVLNAFWSVSSTPAAFEAQHATFYRALAWEGLALWSLLLAASFGLGWATDSAWLRDRARERGWS